MSDEERTERQRAANDALDRAIEEVIAANGAANGSDHVMVSHWMTICSMVGDGSSGVEVIHQNDSTPWPHVFGMLHTARIALERDYVTADDL